MLAFCVALGGPRAVEALRIAGHADGCAEFHQRLIEVARARCIDQGGCKLLHLAADPGFACGFSGFPTSKAAKHALHIAVDHGDVFAVGDAGDSGSGVSSDAGQFAQIHRGCRDAAAEFLRNKVCRLVQHAGAAVVAETAPKREHVLLAGFGQRKHRGKAVQKGRVALNDHGHAGLLQHDLRNPDGVGVASGAPREVAPIGVVPLQHGTAQASERLGFCIALQHGSDYDILRPADVNRTSLSDSASRP